MCAVFGMRKFVIREVLGFAHYRFRIPSRLTRQPLALLYESGTNPKVSRIGDVYEWLLIGSNLKQLLSS